MMVPTETNDVSEVRERKAVGAGNEVLGLKDQLPVIPPAATSSRFFEVTQDASAVTLDDDIAQKRLDALLYY
jgi:hypothetical protein